MKWLLCVLWFVLIPKFAQAEVRSYLDREAFERDVVERLVRGDYASVDDLAERALASKARFADGRWKLNAIYDAELSAFRRMADQPGDRTRIIDGLRAVAVNRPTSRNAWLLYAQAIHAQAWSLRGNGFASEVTAAGWTGFRQQLALEAKVLDAQSVRMRANPAWHSHRITLALERGEGRHRIDALYAAGVQVEPDDEGIRFAALRTHEAIWGGSVEDTVKFINSLSPNSKGARRAPMYVRAVWASGESLLEHPDIDWKKIKQSMSDVLNEYPDDWNIQEFLLMACMKSDKAQASRLQKLMKEEPSSALLGRNLALFGTCRQWAAGQVPGFLMRDPETGKETFIQ